MYGEHDVCKEVTVYGKGKSYSFTAGMTAGMHNDALESFAA